MSKKTCFVISPIGEAGSVTRKRANQIYSYVIKAVLREDEWKIERADNIPEPGIITNQIIERLINSDLVIADLSERNPNVFYELAVRHIAKKPYVHLIAHDEDIPFDNAPVRAIKVDIHDLDSVDEAKKELAAQVTHALSENAVVESPVSVAISLSDLKKSGDKEGILLQSLVNEMSTLRRTVGELAGEIQQKSVLRTGLLGSYRGSPGSRMPLVDSNSETTVNALLQRYIDDAASDPEVTAAGLASLNALAPDRGTSAPASSGRGARSKK